jgi:hypothetical protein
MITVRGGTSLGTGLAITGLGLIPFWGLYFALGGSHTPDELQAYLNGESAWTAHEHDAAAHALNEYCTTIGLGYPVAYANEL